MQTGEPREQHLRILSVIRRIPRGRVTTYGDLALRAGLPRRARLVGFVLGNSPLASEVPWHRVLRSDGRIAARDGDGMAEQRRRLIIEGVQVSATGRVNLELYGWKAGRTRRRAAAVRGAPRQCRVASVG